jgi:transcriptional regulator with XRE-family HTH domain
LTQEELGEATGLSYRYLQDIERGRKNVTIETIARLAQALRAKPFELLKSARLDAARVGRPRKREGS